MFRISEVFAASVGGVEGSKRKVSIRIQPPRYKHAYIYCKSFYNLYISPLHFKDKFYYID